MTRNEWMDSLNDLAEHVMPDLVVFSHLRWDFVFQRPQHIMTRHAQNRRVFFVEEPMFSDECVESKLHVSDRTGGVKIVVPLLPQSVLEAGEAAVNAELEPLIEEFIHGQGIALDNYTAWYYTPMALEFTRNLTPATIVYDCMDQLSAFAGAHSRIEELEEELFSKADVVFTGGHSLYEEKKKRHSNIHPIPSSIDASHFGKARGKLADPADQAAIPHPRLGFFGVVDERFDTKLLRKSAELRPDWHFVILGPAIKIDPQELPQRENIHYLGMKKYDELPAYLAHWDVATILFARNDSTRFISPTKTPEYLAAGCPVVSTSIRDVVHPYATNGLVKIADTAVEFVQAAQALMSMGEARKEWLAKVDTFLASMCWSRTLDRMAKLEHECLVEKTEETDFEGKVSIPGLKTPFYEART